MVKTKKLNPQYPLVITGYILFTVLIIGVLLSTTIPFGRMLFNPRTLHQNVAIFTIALTVGALLPAFLGYLIGDKSVKSNGRMSHHFNGVLFGLLAFWVMSIFSVIVSIPSEYFTGTPNTRIVLINLLPSTAVAIIATILTIAHLRSTYAKRDILEYKPYSILLIGSVGLLPVWSLINNIFTHNVSMYTFVPLIILMVLGAISYATLRNNKINVLTKLTWSAVSVSVAYVALFVSSQLVNGLSYYVEDQQSMQRQVVVGSAGWILALIGWIIYWRVQTKSLSLK